MAEAVIDLDYAAGGGMSTRSKLSSGWRHRVGLALTAAVTGLGLVASGPPPGAWLVELNTLDASSIVSKLVVGPRLVALVTGSGMHVMAIDLADARPLWQTPVDGTPSTTFLDVAGETVLVDTGGGSASGVRIQALDVHTGRLLWRNDLPRLVWSGLHGTVLVAAPLDKDGRPVPSAQGPSIEAFAESPLLICALDAATGRAIWTYQVPAGWRAVLGDDPSGADPSDRFVVVAPTGQAHAVDLASGRVQATATIAVDPSGTADRNQRGQAVLHGNQLLVTHLRQGRPSLTAYGTDTLSPQWTAEISTLTTDVSRCLQLLCLRDSREVHAVMPTTGAKVWTTNGLTRYSVVDRWLYEAPPFNQPGSARLVDPATARTLLDLGRWRFAAQDPGQPPLFELVEQSSRIWLGLLVPGPRIRPLGTVTGISEAVPPYGPPPCHAGTGYLFCTTTTQQLRIWHFRR